MSLKEQWQQVTSDNFLFRNLIAFFIGYAYLLQMTNILDGVILIFTLLVFFAFNFRYFQLIQNESKSNNSTIG